MLDRFVVLFALGSLVENDQVWLSPLRVPEHLSEATPEQLTALVPSLIKSQAATVVWHDGPLSQNHNAYGGAPLLNSSGQVECTTAFSVKGLSNDGILNDGILTAGHCPNDLIYNRPQRHLIHHGVRR